MEAKKETPLTVSTEVFWNLMCKASFRRLDLHRGSIGTTIYYAEVPPEATAVVVDSVERILECLAPQRRPPVSRLRSILSLSKPANTPEA